MDHSQSCCFALYGLGIGRGRMLKTASEKTCFIFLKDLFNIFSFPALSKYYHFLSHLFVSNCSYMDVIMIVLEQELVEAECHRCIFIVGLLGLFSLGGLQDLAGSFSILSFCFV